MNITPYVREWGGARESGLTTARGLSSKLWDRFRSRVREPDLTEDGVQFFDDFVNFGAGAGTSYLGYGLHLDTGSTINQVATEEGGVIRIACDTTDNDSSEITTGGNIAGMLKLLSSDAKMVAFEARVLFTQVTDIYNFFVGLSEEGCAADDGLFTDAGASADKDMIGFRVLEANGDALEFIYKKAGQTLQATAGLKALTVATWYRLGFIYDPSAVVANRLQLYIDNTLLSTQFTQTDIEAATFPAGEELAMTAGVKNGSAAVSSVDMDWWAAAAA